MEADRPWSERLPPELWQIVLSQTPSATTRECLAVSRFFHDLAARILFSTLRIHFGCWEVGYGFTKEPPEGDRGCKSCCILLRVITDPVFASFVKELHVLAFADVATFEICGLTNAISIMHNLRTFKWYTTFRPHFLPGDNILMALASTAVNLREYTLPIQCLGALSALKRLPASSLCIYNLDESFEMEPDPYEEYRTSCPSLLESRRGSLTQLTAPSQAIWECPIHILQDLTHLTIENGGDLSNITLLFHHCTQLQALHIVSRFDSPTEFYIALAAHPSALPHLTHLKLQLMCPVVAAELESLGGFIRTKKKLRCLDYDDEGSTLQELSPLLFAIQSLSGLEVLGLYMWLHDIGRTMCDLLRGTIPHGLKALRLWFGYIELDPEDNAWDGLWATLPKLAFAHIVDDASLPIVELSDIVVANKSLRLVGRRSCLCQVVRTGDEVELSKPWPLTKVQFRTTEDFECEDWEWLMRGHALVDERDYY
ncbi:uncharacterized protein B0H18DRAFT_1053817 [Fomitopsis serialis]|uniref:uncharacterized protein n=1 Tax=Fomitopsis serialis TaxID=139415 RepID=UPI002008C810|nr:uncharacterized protein B0H18DRAFT_1053817 [Neoantrodia serialis]KAH9912459.1 hypothetical protein B0H18DRAFT_1053817 [Neoantrodia serialis]